MKIIALMSQKGGAGKSTLAVHLAVAAQAKGLRVHVIDCDPQGSIVTWSRLRKDDDLMRTCEPRRLKHLIEGLDADLVFVDTPGHLGGMDTIDPMSVSDLVVVPVRPSVFDVAASYKMLSLITEHKKQGLVVLSAAPLRAPEISVARKALAAYMPVATTVVHDRRPFARAIQTGRSVSEFDPKSPGAVEIDLLLTEIRSFL